jgi:hypothetical protein
LTNKVKNELNSQNILKYYVNENQNNWVQLLSMIQFVYNNTRNEITNITSFQTNYKYESKIWQDSQNHELQSQKVILNIVEIKNCIKIWQEDLKDRWNEK